MKFQLILPLRSPRCCRAVSFQVKKKSGYNFYFVVSIFNQHLIFFLGTAAAGWLFFTVPTALLFMGGPSLLDGLPPLSVAKTLSYFHDLTECPKSHPLAKSICLLSLSHALSFKGHSGQGKENLKSSFFQTSPRPKKPPKDEEQFWHK